MSPNQQDLGPLIARVQKWWSEQHEHPMTENLGGLFKNPCGFGCDWQARRSPEALVASLRPFLSTGVVDLAHQLQTPDVQVARQVAGSLLPQPYGMELELVTGVIEVAGAQTVKQREKAVCEIPHSKWTRWLRGDGRLV
jgi:hypothetical protein